MRGGGGGWMGGLNKDGCDITWQVIERQPIQQTEARGAGEPVTAVRCAIFYFCFATFSALTFGGWRVLRELVRGGFQEPLRPSSCWSL